MSQEGCNDVKAHAAPSDPSPTRTRQPACGEGAPAEHDERIRNRPMALRLGFMRKFWRYYVSTDKRQKNYSFFSS